MQSISTSEIENLIYVLAKQILYTGIPYRRVVGIANGGLHISRHLADLLGLPHESVYVSRYDGFGKRDQPIISGRFSKPTGNLIVDDLVDEGGTFQLVDQYFGLQGNATAVLYWNKTSLWKPTYFAAEKPDGWVYFPWEPCYNQTRELESCE